MTPNKITLLIVSLVGFPAVVGWMLLTKERSTEQPPVAIMHPNGQAFAGSASCQNCHRDLYNSHRQTAHGQTSQPADASAIRGSFATGENSFSFGPDAQVVAERRADGIRWVT